jgi:DegV family protein with EDD domain
MGKIKLMIDSSSEIPKWYAKEHDITVIPLTITFGERQFVDYYELYTDGFYRELENSPVLPTSSQPNPYTFMEYFNRYDGEFDDIICITLSSNGSGTYNSGCIAANEFNERSTKTTVHMIDTHQASLGVFLFLDLAVKRRAEGKSAQEICDELLEVRPKVATYFIPQTLEYLRRGGRVNTVTAVVGELLGIHPIITIIGGWGRNYGKIKGNAAMIKRLFELFSEQHAEETVYISHGNNEEIALKLEKKLKDAFPNIRTFVSCMGSTMGTHAGPGALGAHFIRSKIHGLG